jgi:hypothetical protein
MMFQQSDSVRLCMRSGERMMRASSSCGALNFLLVRPTPEWRETARKRSLK